MFESLSDGFDSLSWNCDLSQRIQVQSSTRSWWCHASLKNPPSIFEELNYVYSKLPPPLFCSLCWNCEAKRHTANSGPISQHVEEKGGWLCFNPTVMQQRFCLTSAHSVETVKQNGPASSGSHQSACRTKIGWLCFNHSVVQQRFRLTSAHFHRRYSWSSLNSFPENYWTRY
jgi:hypothetical protein